MLRRIVPLIAVASVALLAGCYSPPPQNAQPMVYNPAGMTPPYATTTTVVMAPSAPPPNPYETVPPAPSSTAYWQAGHWTYLNGQWTWINGQYVQSPSPNVNAWVPGHWEQASNGYVWVNGYWQ
jgi:hypothetical protein